MTTTENEWREKLRLEISFIESSNLKSVEDFREAILDVCQNTIQNLLTTHSAHQCRHCKVAEAQGATHIHPAHEWRLELRALMQMEEMPTLEAFIQNLLTTHSAHLVERIEKAKLDEKKVNNDLNLIGQISIYNEALDQAIDIIKDNK